MSNIICVCHVYLLILIRYFCLLSTVNVKWWQGKFWTWHGVKLWVRGQKSNQMCCELINSHCSHCCCSCASCNEYVWWYKQLDIMHFNVNRNQGKSFWCALDLIQIPKLLTYVGIGTLVHRTTMVNGRRRPWQPPPPWRDLPAQNHGCHGNIWSDLATLLTRTAW